MHDPLTTQTHDGNSQQPCRIIAVANQKGGVGKTTTAVSVAAAAAELNKRVLLVDLDPQSNATTGSGLDPQTIEASMYHVLLHELPMDDVVQATTVKNLFIAPSSMQLAGAEMELVSAFSRETKLRVALDKVSSDYDLVIIDCPPSLGLITINALTATKHVLVPIQCEYFALEGVGQLIRNIDLVKRNLNPELELAHVVLVMFDGRTNLANQVVDEVRQHFGDRVCRTVIPRSIKLSEAPAHGLPITVFDTDSRGAAAYRSLAAELLEEPHG